MAILTISEHSTLPLDVNSKPLYIMANPLAVAAYTPSATSAQTTAFNANTKYVRLATDVAVHVTYAATATTSHDWLPAGSVEWFAVSGGGQLAFRTAA